MGKRHNIYASITSHPALIACTLEDRVSTVLDELWLNSSVNTVTYSRERRRLIASGNRLRDVSRADSAANCHNIVF